MLLSILIRNLNEAENLKFTLQSIRKQVCDFPYEIIVVDNESEDNSVEIALAAGAKVISLKRDDFSFGHALNFGIEHCAGQFILIMSAHVILLSELFLQQLPVFFNDEKVAGLRFINTADRQQVIHSIQDGPRQLVYTREAGFADMHWMHLLVNHCAAIRRSCWNVQHYDAALPASEDKRWSLDILIQGYTLLYHVPCYYAYIKQPTRVTKARRMAIETAAKEMITGTPATADSGSINTYYSIVTKGLKKIYSELETQHKYAAILSALKKVMPGQKARSTYK